MLILTSVTCYLFGKRKAWLSGGRAYEDKTWPPETRSQIHRQKYEGLFVTTEFDTVTCGKGVGNCHLFISVYSESGQKIANDRNVEIVVGASEVENSPPQFSISPDSGSAPLTVVVVAENPQGNIVGYEWI